MTRRNRAFVNDPERAVIHPSPSSALRELRTHLCQPRVVLALLGVGTILALVGPFGTANVLSWMPRISYWLVVPTLTYAIGYLLNSVVWSRLHAHLPRIPAIAASALLVGLVIAGAVFGLNLLIFGLRPSGFDFATLFGISTLVSLLIELLPRETTPQNASPAILDRLPLDKRGALISLSVEDHYVRIRTTRGEEMVLLRLSDAIREAAPTPGLRVHRSHWVATAQVTAANRKGDGAVLSMAQGGDIPVSRSHMPAIRDAGLLPR